MESLRNSIDLILEEIEAVDSYYHFYCDKPDGLILNYYLKPERRKRLSQFRKICQKHLSAHSIETFQSNVLDKIEFDNHIKKLKDDPNWVVVTEPIEVIPPYTGSDLAIFNIKENFFP